ncbi:MAG: diadenylate cyclase CdaA [Lachnospiraceae bacterium]|nr:diadenylate cyclase CdaA [Lachnospiraceae bacterium]MBP5254532.1 diadenylate cyclase CdaA [Lachnospiraceae bacterium]
MFGNWIQRTGETISIGGINLTFSVSSVIEIILFSILAYYLISWIKRTKSWNLLKGAGILAAIYVIARLIGLDNILFLFENLFGSIVLAVIVIFQPELRQGLEHLGSTNRIRGWLLPVPTGIYAGGMDEETSEELLKALNYMSKHRVGALIVIEQENRMDEVIQTGIALDAVITTALIEQIFEHNTPLHDGAVVIRKNRIVAATCYLPLSQNMDISKELGTRHRAGLGISETTDCITLIASEETGALSIAQDGRLTQNVTIEDIRNTLYSEDSEASRKTGLLAKLFGRRKKDVE